MRKLFFRTATALVTIMILETGGLALAQSEQAPTTPDISVQNNTGDNQKTSTAITQDDQKENQPSDEQNNENSDDSKDFTNIIKQSTDYTCGPAALATLIGLMGGKADEMQIAKLSGTTEEKGTTILGLKNAAIALGYNVSLKNTKLNSIKSKLPVLAHEKTEENGDHYVVIKEIGSETVKLADPSAGNIEPSREDFEKSFSGKVIILSLPQQVKSGQSADVALQVLENQGIEELNVNGKMVSIDDLQEELSDEEAGNTSGKFAQVMVLFAVPGAGQLLLVGTTLVATGWLVWLLATNKNYEKGFDSLRDKIKQHVEKMEKDPCGYPSYPDETDGKIKSADRLFDKSSNKFRNSNSGSWSNLKSRAKTAIKKAKEAINRYRCKR